MNKLKNSHLLSRQPLSMLKKSIQYIYFDRIDSTNGWVRMHAHHLSKEHFTCVIAREQTAGKGRFKRVWISPRGENIYASLFFTLKATTPYISYMGQLMAYSCIESLRSALFPAYLKWPNDIFIEGKKVGGVLTESFFIENEIGILIGLGLNVDLQEEVLTKINQPATSLSRELGANKSGRSWLKAILERFYYLLTKLQCDSLPSFQESLKTFLSPPIKQNSENGGTSRDKNGILIPRLQPPSP